MLGHEQKPRLRPAVSRNPGRMVQQNAVHRGLELGDWLERMIQNCRSSSNRKMSEGRRVKRFPWFEREVDRGCDLFQLRD
jgi:hypothetical protein